MLLTCRLIHHEAKGTHKLAYREYWSKTAFYIKITSPHLCTDFAWIKDDDFKNITCFHIYTVYDGQFIRLLLKRAGYQEIGSDKKPWDVVAGSHGDKELSDDFVANLSWSRNISNVSDEAFHNLGQVLHRKNLEEAEQKLEDMRAVGGREQEVEAQLETCARLRTKVLPELVQVVRRDLENILWFC